MGIAMAIGAAAGSADVVWAGAGRSPATRDRATAAGVKDAGDLGGLTAVADVVISVCPPDAALELARAVAATGFQRTFVDANAISPATAAEIDQAVTAAGATYVDGGIIGAPTSPRLLLTVSLPR
jgi:3-hydroxyisobutyrate dehydrogenase-like beta-hydroxyacid dehydrogenase